MNTLKQIFDKHKCDKGTSRHRYDRIYEPIFKQVQNQSIRILEIGVLRGESIKAWLEYFPKAEIACIDIFGRVKAKEVDVLKENRVMWAKCDSIKGPNEDFQTTLAKDGFDFIIDDGLHSHRAQRKTFENFIPFLKDTGAYFIEDVWPFNIMSVGEKHHQWIQKHPHMFSDQKYNELLKALAPYQVTFHDKRRGYQPDTYIIEVRK